jgi:hypothetical protein
MFGIQTSERGPKKMLATTRKSDRIDFDTSRQFVQGRRPQPQRCSCCSVGPSTYRAPFLGYFSKSCAISARSSVDSSTSPPARFSNVRFAFLPRPHGVHGSEESTTNEVHVGKRKTHEDPGSGIMWSPRAPTHAMHSCATVMPFRFAMADKPSTNWRLCPIFWGRVGMSEGGSEAGT